MSLNEQHVSTGPNGRGYYVFVGLHVTIEPPYRSAAFGDCADWTITLWGDMETILSQRTATNRETAAVSARKLLEHAQKCGVVAFKKELMEKERAAAAKEDAKRKARQGKPKTKRGRPRKAKPEGATSTPLAAARNSV